MIQRMETVPFRLGPAKSSEMGRIPPHPRCFRKWQIKELRDTELGSVYGEWQVSELAGASITLPDEGGAGMTEMGRGTNVGREVELGLNARPVPEATGEKSL